MPSYERELDLVQGYNFKKDVQKPIGFITGLTIGGNNILADQQVSTPINDMKSVKTTMTDSEVKAGSLKVVSVLKKVKWDLGDVDPIEFEGTVSVQGKQMLMGLLFATMINIDVTVSYVVYEYDPLARVYYVAFSNSPAGNLDVKGGGKGVAGMIKKDGDNLALTVQPTPSQDVQSPENYDFTLQIVPSPTPQPLYLAAASTRRVTKYWGRLGPAGAKGK